MREREYLNAEKVLELMSIGSCADIRVNVAGVDRHLTVMKFPSL